MVPSTNVLTTCSSSSSRTSKRPTAGVRRGPSTYTDGDASSITHTATREWNHGLGEIVQSVIDAGLVVTALHELRYCDSLFLPNVMERRTDGAAVLRTRPERLPLSYTLQARQPG